jgi:hypothetical protein
MGGNRKGRGGAEGATGSNFIDYAGLRVRAAFAAAWQREVWLRFAAAALVWRESEDLLAVPRGSRLRARSVAWERFLETLRTGCSPARSSCAAFSRTEAEPLGGGSFTPARRALESPIAMACYGDRTPCLPSRT